MVLVKNIQYNILKSIFNNSLCISVFTTPNLGIKIAHYWSRQSRRKGGQFNKVELRKPYRIFKT